MSDYEQEESLPFMAERYLNEAGRQKSRGGLKAFKLASTILASVAVLTYGIAAMAISDQGGGGGGFLIFAMLIGVAPAVVYQAGVKSDRAIVVCGTILVVTTVPAWILPIFSDNAFALFYALFFVFPLTLIATIAGASIGRDKSQSQRPWWNPTG